MVDLLGVRGPGRSRGARAALVLALTLAAGLACSAREEPRRAAEAAEGRREEARPARSASEGTAVGAPGARVPSREDAGAGTPRRAASDRLVEEGKGSWIAGRDEEARAKLEQALRIDGSNGVAYYVLAEIAADAREWSDAEGYHAQAEALLSGRPEFRQALSDLAERIAARR